MTDRRDSATWRERLARLRAVELALIFLPAFALFGIGAMTDIALPGVYADAVNPDFLVVRLFTLHHAQLPESGLPGLLLFGLFPVIGQIYHGALPNYVGLPFYTLFGTGVVGIRLTNMVFGLIVLAGTGAFMRAFHARAVICALCLGLLALDPGFLFSFRTQFYITLLPVAALLASAAVIEVYADAPTRRAALISGLLSGIACYGYFIYGFLIPAVALYALFRWGRLPSAGRVGPAWIGGLLLGVLPYPIGYLMILRATGTHGLVGFTADDLRGGSTDGIAFPPLRAVQVFVEFVRGTILDVGPTSMMFKQYIPLAMPRLKTALLLAVPGAAIVSALLRPTRVRGLLLLAGVLLGFLVLVMVFGRRMWLHHAALILPLLYAALALALERFATLIAPRRRWCATLVATLVVAPFLIANALDRRSVFAVLEATHGVGLLSDAIDRYAEDSLRIAPTAHRFFPDWGVSMPFVMLTRGAIPASLGFSPAAARALLCSGTDVQLVTLASEPAKRLQDWIAAVGVERHEVSQYDQKDGAPVLDVVLWRAADRPSGLCG